ncbi:calcineurin-like phosphoesterase family protein [Candidatus Sumerlaeota bacterium]|nr:calcineurin-like phosphoesterase family protein [Candidatus Sumerlaeota bacterium]
MAKSSTAPIKTFIIFILVFLVCIPLWSAEVSGIVFLDANKNLRLDPGEKGVPGVLVSNQQDVVKTDLNGRYSLPVGDETIIFITKPAGFATPLDKNNLPQFYYIHQPKGSPPTKYKGVDPTGPLPKSLNFPLFKTDNPESFEVIVMSDPQPLNAEEIGFIRDDIVPELIGTKALFGITLGDIMFDDLTLYDKYNAIISQVGIPFYNVPGNHDMNYDAPDDHYALETFKRHYGPPYYSFDYGKVHFIVLDDVEWHPKTDKKKGWYQGMIGEPQLTWLKNDLQFVGKDKLIVFAMHIPIRTILGKSRGATAMDKEKLFELLKGREHILFLAGHTHTLEHHFLGKDIGWRGKKPVHQLICATVCGSWWGGPKDERGIPVADQRDGTPNGYHIFRFEGNTYTERFKPASRGIDYQIRICSPVGKITREELKNTQIIVNVFDGSERSDVECQVDTCSPAKMTRTIMEDPFFKDLYEDHKDSFKSFVKPRPCSHIWTAKLPDNLKPGIHRIIVRTTDQFGNSYTTARLFEVE